MSCSLQHRSQVNTRSTIDLSAFEDSRYAELLRSRSWRLGFPRDLERQFDEFHLQRILGRVRVFCVPFRYSDIAPSAVVISSAIERNVRFGLPGRFANARIRLR